MKPKKLTKALKRAEALEGIGKTIADNLSVNRVVTQPVKVKDAVTTHTSENICDKARNLATQAARARANEEATREQEFMDSLFPDRSQYTNHGDHTYTICGLRWHYSMMRYLWGNSVAQQNLYPLQDHPENQYRGVGIFPHYTGSIAATNLTEFGRLLLRRDKHIKFIDATYPDTLWGRIRLWFNYRFL